MFTPTLTFTSNIINQLGCRCEFFSRVLYVVSWPDKGLNPTYFAYSTRFYVRSISSKYLDGEGDKAIVLLNVSLENVRAWPENSLESGSVEFDTFQRTLGGNSSSPWAV